MTREEALAALLNENPHHRFSALRCLERSALNSDIELLLQSKLRETDLYVKKRIERLINVLTSRKHISIVDEDSIDPEIKRKVRAEAIEWVAGILLHEIGSKLGLLASSVSAEIPNYLSSNSKRRVEQLKNIFDGIEELKKATSSPKPIEMDLSLFIRELVEFESLDKDIECSFVGKTPLVIFCDRGLLSLALCNGIKNAIDAAITVRSEERRPAIIVSWGQTDIDNWITVIDNGAGLPTYSARSFSLGESTKSGHLGFGLGIARQAIETLNGTVELRNSGADGATYELRWSLIV